MNKSFFVKGYDLAVFKDVQVMKLYATYGKGGDVFYGADHIFFCFQGESFYKVGAYFYAMAVKEVGRLLKVFKGVVAVDEFEGCVVGCLKAQFNPEFILVCKVGKDIYGIGIDKVGAGADNDAFE